MLTMQTMTFCFLNAIFRIFLTVFFLQVIKPDLCLDSMIMFYYGCYSNHMGIFTMLSGFLAYLGAVSWQHVEQTVLYTVESRGRHRVCCFISCHSHHWNHGVLWCVEVGETL